MVKTVFVFANGMVAVCDEKGEQISEYQGNYEEVKDKILANAPENTEWNGWPGRETVVK